MKVNLVAITPNAEEIILHCARVNVHDNLKTAKSTRLINYLIKNKHWSPFEHAHMTVEIITSRDISRQAIRHRSHAFQEFSQRYHKAAAEPIFKEARLQDDKNRQNSLETDDAELKSKWLIMQTEVWEKCIEKYNEAIGLGIAKEQARALLPEGLTKTKYYQTACVRDWIFYCKVRMDPTTQKEHREIANAIWKIMKREFPTITEALEETE